MIGGQPLFPVVKGLQNCDFENFIQKRNDDANQSKDLKTLSGPPTVDPIEVAIHENINLQPDKKISICLQVQD